MHRLLPLLPLFLFGCGGEGGARRSLCITPKVATLRPGESRTFVLNYYNVNHGHIELEMLDRPAETTFDPDRWW